MKSLRDYAAPVSISKFGRAILISKKGNKQENSNLHKIRNATEVAKRNRETRVVLLRVDTGSGGIHGPLFADGSFDYIPIPDRFGGKGVDSRTYGNTRCREGRSLVDYFGSPQGKVLSQSIHFDPEFLTYTYGDPTPPKASLRKLGPGDLLVFYVGLKGWDDDRPAALYIIGYFRRCRRWVSLSQGASPRRSRDCGSSLS
jgi:hypothetical protein